MPLRYTLIYLCLAVTILTLDATSSRVKRLSCTCKAKSQCAAAVSSKSQTSSFACNLPSGKKGFCCRNVAASNNRRTLLSTRTSSTTSSRLPAGVSNADVQNSLSKTRITQRFSGPDDVETKGHRLFTKARKEDKALSDFAKKLLQVADDVGISTRQASISSDNSRAVEDLCPWLNERKPQCGSNPTVNTYRTVDGSCNNIRNPLYGVSGSPMNRFLPSTYDEKNLPRAAKSGSQLPSARKVSQTAFSIGSRDNRNDISVYFMQMGQFIDHDLTHAPAAESECCERDSQGRHWVYPNDPYNGQPGSCFPIRISRNDPFWGRKGRQCMEFSRSEPSPPIPSCEAGKREQMTALTHWLDLSNTYGNTETEANDVRDTSDRSRLKVSRSGRSAGRDLLPSCSRGRSGIEACEEVCEETKRSCVFAGDLRVNEQPGLTVMHTLWVREHNRVAGELKNIRNAPAEIIFQEARKIVIAEWQHIIYNEWLPILLGFEYMKSFDLLPVTEGYTRDYDDGLDPRINNEFAAAAFRFGHSMITSHIPTRDTSGRNISTLDLKDTFNDPSFLKEPDFIANTIRGYTQETAPAWDPVFVEDIVNHLFEEDAGQGGLDLTALNIQRARDHGIPGYNNYRKLCASSSANFGSVRNFDDLTNGGYLSRDDVRKLNSLYDDVDDIDLFIGGTLEEPHRDSILGPTFKCLIGDQFIRFKKGDRFWYENGSSRDSRFSEVQLNEVRKASMARILCDNTDIVKVQPLVFRVADNGDNNFIQCSDRISIPRLNLDVFNN